MDAGARSFRLNAAEALFLGAIVLGSGGLGLALGKDAGWDLLNYHWYNPYAFLHDRMGFDVAVAHHATYYNPLIDVPFYVLATALSSWVAIFFLGALQGLNAVPLYLIGRAALRGVNARWGAAILAFVCMTGSTVLALTRAACYDNILTILIFAGLAVLIVAHDRLAAGGRAALGFAGLAGLLAGSAVGLKLVEGFFALGVGAALLAIPGRARTRLERLFAFGAGGVLGVILFGGYWFFVLARETGNPLFPYFNDIFRSPLILEASHRDTRFVPHGILAALTFPFRFSFDHRVADDMPFHDFRVLAAYVTVIAASVLWAVGRQARDPLVSKDAARVLFVFAGASYAAWIAMFAIYRYIVGFEMLAPLLVFAAAGLMPLPPRARLAAAAAVLLAATTASSYRLHKGPPLGDPYVQVKGIAILNPARAMVLTTGLGEPTAFMIPSLPPEIPVLRIHGYLAGPGDGSALTATMQARVRAHQGELYLLAPFVDGDATAGAVAAYGLVLEEARCATVTTNLSGPYRFCPLERVQRERSRCRRTRDGSG